MRPDSLYEAIGGEETFRRLVAKGVVIVTGGVGCGKTALMRYIRERIADRFVVAQSFYVEKEKEKEKVTVDRLMEAFEPVSQATSR